MGDVSSMKYSYLNIRVSCAT